MKEAALIGFFLIAGHVQAKEYVIDDYKVTWRVATIGKVELTLEKEEDSLNATLARREVYSSSFMTFSPREIEGIAPVLSKANEYFNKQKGKGKVKDEIKVGAFSVMFSSSPESGYNVMILKKKGIYVDSISMDRKEAMSLAGELEDIVAKSVYLDSKASF